MNYRESRCATSVSCRLVRLNRGGSFSTATCQILPPNFPAYHPYCPYTLDPKAGAWTAPDLVSARKLIARSGTAGMQIKVFDGFRSEGAYFVSLLNQLGYRATLRYIPFEHGYYDVVFAAAAATTVQAFGSEWTSDYPAAGPFLTPFRCGGGNRVCNHAIDRKMRQASDLQAVSRTSADRLWAEIDRELVDQAVAVPLTNSRDVDFFSRRVGNYQHHPVFGVLLDQLWVR